MIDITMLPQGPYLLYETSPHPSSPTQPPPLGARVTQSRSSQYVIHLAIVISSEVDISSSKGN